MASYSANDDWSILGVANDPTPGKPEEIAQLAAEFSRASSTLLTTVQALRSTSGTYVKLNGQFYQAFSAKKGEVSRLAESVKDESDRVKTTLDSWGSTVADCQGKIAGELEKAKQAKETIDLQNLAITEARNDSDEAHRESSRTVIERAQKLKAQAQTELNDCKSRAAQIVNEYNRADSACNARLQGAVPTALAGIAGFAGLTKGVRSFGSRGIKLYKGAKVYKELKGKRFSVVSHRVGKKGRLDHDVMMGNHKMYEKNRSRYSKIGRKYAEEFKKRTDVDFTTIRYARTAAGKMDWSEVGKAAKRGFKDGLNIASDFKGYKNASWLTKSGKALGAAGTVLSAVSNIKSDFIDDTKSSTAEKTKNFVVDTAVDVGSGAAAGAIGAAAGSLILPPAGTIAGYAVGIGASILMNQKFGGQSLTGVVKSGLKGMFHF
ncbi:hypothetical protein EJ419_02185 [Alloscardovia theropitheci]|uniref:LXG domain-containing protein n=2 Tax=Alloscardovia theropitheci TaxID=2496842 RepID=A0A4R0QTN7_9BIFI|nr:hypothetical protein [Alloscardovia theropitheci]TCD54665.1 hypothetical protein EJ419_02185 [Alloscardovia theropitheci]